MGIDHPRGNLLDELTDWRMHNQSEQAATCGDPLKTGLVLAGMMIVMLLGAAWIAFLPKEIASS